MSDILQLPVFVYGTLKRGEPNYPRYLAGFTIGEMPAILPHAVLYTAGPYPFLLMEPDLAEPDEFVHGALIRLRPSDYDAVMRRLDNLEGYIVGGRNNLYERVIVTVQVESGPQQAYVYVAGAETLAAIRQGQLRKILSGNWRGDGKYEEESE